MQGFMSGGGKEGGSERVQRMRDIREEGRGREVMGWQRERGDGRCYLQRCI